MLGIAAVSVSLLAVLSVSETSVCSWQINCRHAITDGPRTHARAQPRDGGVVSMSAAGTTGIASEGSAGVAAGAGNGGLATCESCRWEQKAPRLGRSKIKVACGTICSKLGLELGEGPRKIAK